MKLSRSVALAVTAGALALPAVASAHPGVFTVTQKVLPAGQTCTIDTTPNPEACLTTRTQYAVGNDGYALSFTEGNGAPADRGLINYKSLPGTWRGAATAENRAKWLAYAGAQTNLQAHATCLGGAWDTPANILAWQDDPFFDYIPWQKTGAGIGDHPDEWLTLVKTLTNVDLTTLNTPAEFEAACEAPAVGGTYYAADVSASITNAQVAAAVTAATGALNAEIETLEATNTTLTGENATLTEANGTLTTEKSTLTSQVTALTTEVEDLKKGVFASNPLQSQVAALTEQVKTVQAANEALVNRPLFASLSAKRFDQGVAMVTGKAGAAVTVTMSISAADAKKLKISKTLSTKQATLDAQGAGLVNLTLSGKAAKAIDKAKGTLKVTVTATSGNETSDVSGTLTR
jgi:hypothetical protein